MNYKTHRIGGICSGMITANFMFHGAFTPGSITIGTVILLGTYVGSILPDIDHPESFIGRRFKILSLGTNAIFGHRKFFHSLLFLLLFSNIMMTVSLYFTGIYQIFFSQFILGVIIGIFSHIMIDSLTVGGIPFLYPFIKKSFRLAKFRTNKDEGKVTLLCLFITALVFYPFLATVFR